MLSLQTYKESFLRHKGAIRILLLASFWITGILAGYAVAAKISYFSLMRPFLLERVSIVGLVFATFFPLLMSAVAFRLSLPLLVLPIAFIKAFLLGFSASALNLIYADAGWLARCLYIFADSIMVVFLLWFWVRNITGNAEQFKRDFAISLLAATFLICIDYFIVSPFSVVLFNYS